MKLSQKDIDVLRELAGRCREISDSEPNQVRRQHWKDLNDLKHSGPPLLLVATSTQGAWKEILDTLPVGCENELARSWERSLRMVIYQHDVIKDDAAFDPVFRIERKLTVSDYGIPFNQARSSQADGAYHDEPVLQNLDSDLDRLHFRDIKVARETSGRNFELASNIFGDLLEVRYRPVAWWTCGLTWEAIKLLGLENFMLAMYDDPDGLHRLMKFLSDEMSNFISFFEREALLDYNNGAGNIGSGGLGYTSQLPSYDRPAEVPVKLSQLWGLSESQETVGVSPEMFGEFVFPYQRPLQERFGLTYYGCCEPVENRWEYIRQASNLRAVSVSPWSNQIRCAELLGRNYVYYRKPNPAPVCVGFNESEIKREFEETLACAGNLNTAMILKDTQTIENHPERFVRWVQMGRKILKAHE